MSPRPTSTAQPAFTAPAAKEADSNSPAVAIEGRFLVDAHVHCYPQFEPARLLGAARRNFLALAGLNELRLSCGLLLLAETTGEAAFERLRQEFDPSAAPIQEGSQSAQVLVDRPAGELPLVIFSGRQIVSREGVEVLALCSTETVADGLDLVSTIDAVARLGALPVLPWGVGKWLGARGRLVAAAVHEARASRLFLGDNGGRPSFWREPRIFDLGQSTGAFILPGTDPLPIAGEEERVGSYAFMMEGKLDQADPLASMRAMLMGLERQPARFGRLQSPVRFARLQVGLRLSRNRRR